MQMMVDGRDARFCVASVFLLGFALRSSDAFIRGVSPEDQQKYAGTTFRCFDGSTNELPAAAVNDDSCDCADGSDEPGTGACAGMDKVLFHCRNAGSIARNLFVSRVGDGICDCCDGSDEEALGKRWAGAGCPNVCEQEGKKRREEASARADWVRQALAKKATVLKEAAVKFEDVKTRLEKIKAELPPLEATLAKAKEAADIERAAEETARKAKEEAEKTEKEAAEKAAAEKAAAEKPDEAKTASVDAPDTQGSEHTPPATPAADEEKPQVSEYTKWMDGAETTVGANQESEEKKPEVSEYTKWMDGAETAMTDEDNTAETEEEQKDVEASVSEADTTETTTQAPQESLAKVEEKNAQAAVDEAKRKESDLQKDLSLFDPEHAAYSSLAGRTISKRVSEFNYKITFFDKADQDSTRLGKWSHWKDSKTALFEGGDHCWQGPSRSLVVKFQCGIEEDILDVIEPSRCVYEASVVAPAACDQAELDELLGSTQKVVGPRDEL